LVTVDSSTNDKIPPLKQIASSNTQTCGVHDNGSVICWGELSGNYRWTSKPDVFSLVSNVKQLAAGEDHMCALKSDGTIKCWGYGYNGQLGYGSTSSTNFSNSSPDNIRTVSGINNAVEISAGGYSTCARLDNGTVQCWGNNNTGQLGNGNTTQRNSPTNVSGITQATQISVGAAHTCAVIDNNTVQCWGNSSNGRLGMGNVNGNQTSPQDVSSLNNITQVSAGQNHTCAVKNSSGSNLYCWGENQYFQVGTNSNGVDYAVPELIGSSKVLNVSAGESFTCVTMNDKSAKCWGYGGNGVLGKSSGGGGLGSTDNKYAQTNTTTWQISDIPGLTDIKQIVAGKEHTCALTNPGRTICWGRAGNYRLGDGSTPSPNR
jgi:alpha-tubulin suppressor-like RCC1 family protein